MANKKNDSRITPANWIAIIAMALLALFTFFGMLYSSGNGQMGMALLFTALEVALLTSALVVAIKSKKETSNFKLWRIVMCVSLVAYVVVALIFASPLLKFFSINAKKDSLKDMAREEIEAIEHLYKDYNKTMQASTDEAVERMQQYMIDINNNATKSPSMDKLLAEWNITSISDLLGTDENPGGWKSDVEEAWKVGEDQELKEWTTIVDQWGFFDIKISQVATAINKKADDVVQSLNAKVDKNVKEKNIIPVISLNPYEHKGFVEKTFERPDVGDFHEELTEGNAKSIIGWIVFVLLHLLILFNFAVTEGDTTVFPMKKAKDTATKGIEL